VSSKATEYSHPKCYARGYNNCSSKISREHFISSALQQQIALNNTVKIAGLSWQEKEKLSVIPISGLASNILCEEHNHALSSLDAQMNGFTQTIKDFDDSIHPSSTDLANEARVFSGDKIERWMIKCLVGASDSGNFRNTSLKSECFDLLFERMEFPEGWGLYFTGKAGKNIYHSDSFLIETFIHPESKQILAANFILRGIPLTLAMGRPDNPKLYGIWRPDQLIFKSEKAQKIIDLNWHSDSSGQQLLLERIGTYDGMPPDWKDWERGS